MNYTEKLNSFNSTEKYHKEIELLLNLISRKGKILDYGCGTGYTVELLKGNGLNVFGYDANKHNESFEYSGATDEYRTVYFMHSFAHITGIKEVLKCLNTKEVVVITPNRQWLNSVVNENYIPDPTVIYHYSEFELSEIFLSCGYRITASGQFGERRGDQMERLFIKCRKN